MNLKTIGARLLQRHKAAIYQGGPQLQRHRRKKRQIVGSYKAQNAEQYKVSRACKLAAYYVFNGRIIFSNVNRV
jgi:hypothetical protein